LGRSGDGWIEFSGIADDPVRERPHTASVGRRRGNPPRNLSGKRTVRARQLWKAGVFPGISGNGVSPTVQVRRAAGGRSSQVQTTEGETGGHRPPEAAGGPHDRQSAAPAAVQPREAPQR